MWIYKGKEITERIQLPGKAIGFVYSIYNTKTNKTYIGKKILLNKRTRPPLKGYKRKRVDYIESNWLKYTGSNAETKKWIIDDCKREIVYICYNRTMMTYYETALQFQLKVLESEGYLNENILGKFYKTKIIQYKDDESKYNQNR
jgi:hypothetical protein